MNPWYTSRASLGLTIFAIAMAGLAAWAYRRFGATPLAVVAAAIAIGCFGAMFYLWRLARRALRPLERVGKPSPQTGKEKP